MSDESGFCRSRHYLYLLPALIANIQIYRSAEHGNCTGNHCGDFPLIIVQAKLYAFAVGDFDFKRLES